jgi:hypothetical protein
VPDQGFAAISDSGKVPLYPRFEALDICTEAVTGEVSVSDTTRWTGIRGKVIVKAAALVTGEQRRDAYARDAVLQTQHYPNITFIVDSVVGVTRKADTLIGTGYGILELHGVTRPAVGPVRAWPEAGGLRVLGRVKFPAPDLVQVFELSRFALGLGVVTRIWQTIFMGVDIVVYPVKH